MGKHEGKISLGRPKHRQENNIEMNFQEVGWAGLDWIDLGEDRDLWWALVNALMNLRVPFLAGNFLTSCGPVSFSGRAVLREVSLFFLETQCPPYTYAAALSRILYLL